jgi:hypothetical protein
LFLRSSHVWAQLLKQNVASTSDEDVLGPNTREMLNTQADLAWLERERWKFVGLIASQGPDDPGLGGAKTDPRTTAVIHPF